MRVSQCTHIYNVFLIMIHQRFFGLQCRPDTFEPLYTKLIFSQLHHIDF